MVSACRYGVAWSGSTGAATVTYDMFICDSRGRDCSNEFVQTLEPGNYTLQVKVKVSENELAPGIPGGILQSAFNLDDSSNLVRRQEVVGFLGGKTFQSDSHDTFYETSVTSHCHGILVEGDSKVIAETWAIQPSSITSWTTVTEGEFSLQSGSTELTLDVANPYGGDILVSALSGSQVVAAVSDLVIGDSIRINVPEPEAIVLLSCYFPGAILGRHSG